ncbi:quinone oxidoreductase family protein [Halalkalibacillus halophilus]|uniref:quinone oxidoreductase family protein n=1 Tax=Halalkalibacillus halophilus TaxID=392827 RepID=UPI0004035B03|nr:quinone oxidoreductase [Halalkalibacillus halophilus]
MKYINITEFGGPEVLTLSEKEQPQPNTDEVLIKVTSIGVNFADTMRRQDQYVIPTPLPFTPGSEVAGEVVACGDQVTNLNIGDKVVSLIDQGAYSEYVTISAQFVIPIPDGLSDKQAVALPLQGLTAYHTIQTMGQMKPNETILIHAAAGGVGTLAVQLAKYFKAGTIIATASRPEKRQLAMDMGADYTVDYTQDTWKQEIMDITNGDGVDVALEMVGGEIFNQTLELLATFGRLVFYGAASGELPTFSPFELMKENKTVNGFFLPQIMRRPDLLASSLSEIMKLAADGQLSITIGGVYPLEEVATCHRDLESRKTTGKLILEP